MSEKPVYKKKDFISDQEVRWCPGCGDYAILSSIQMAMTKLGKKKEDIVFISGIGCSSRFPYYMNTYGLHTIHGRAPAVATGLKLTNPNLEVWVITGDGDGLSIGGNHLIHALRRNVNLNIVLFNNEIYGLTKGQYSPTSSVGTVTKSTPFGSVDQAFNPANLCIGAGTTFFARTMDTDPKHMMEITKAASEHNGVSIIEIYQNCVIFNDKVHDSYTNRKTREETTITVEHGRPLIYGKGKNLGIRLNGFTPESVTIGENGVTEEDLLVHDETNPTLPLIYTQFRGLGLPVPMGIFKKVEVPSFESDVVKQIEEVEHKKGKGSMEKLLKSGETWEVK